MLGVVHLCSRTAEIDGVSPARCGGRAHVAGGRARGAGGRVCDNTQLQGGKRLFLSALGETGGLMKQLMMDRRESRNRPTEHLRPHRL